VTMVARNFLETDNTILYPRIDFAGEKTGITGMEFPILNYLIYLISTIFGYSHWYGRLINLIISSFGIYIFNALIKKYFDNATALNASLILLFSIWFMYARKIMPDTMAMTFIIASIYYGSNYLEAKENKKKYLEWLLSLIFMALGALSKLPSAYLLIIFILFFFKKEIPLHRKIGFSISAFLFMLLPVAWYFYWVPYLVQEFGFWHFFMGKSMMEGALEIQQHIGACLANFYENALKFAGFAFFLIGLYFMFIQKNKILIGLFLLSAFSFSIVILKAGNTFAFHAYYIIPFVPVMALVCAYGINQIKNKKIAALMVIVISLEGILNQQHDFRIHDKEMAIFQLETDLNSISSRNDLILINSGDVPTPMYFAHRKGWINSNEKIANENYVRDLKQKGLKFIVILNRVFGTDLKLNYTIVFKNEDYCIYEL
jgi:Dolichyl-phosphate-mannose-protein mannosyltransferase